MQGQNPSQFASREEQIAFSHVLSLDIGGTFLKAGVVDRDGNLISTFLRTPTPRAATPQAVIAALNEMIAQLPAFDRIAVGFPGLVKREGIVTAPNLGTELWRGYPLSDTLHSSLGRQVRVVNDAIMHGLGCIEGDGMECVLTLGTGMGCALFKYGSAFHGLELGQHFAANDKNYDQLVGQRSLEEVGLQGWNRRVEIAISAVDRLTNCDRLYISGGNAKRISFTLPPHVSIAKELANLSGGARLWQSRWDSFREVA